MSKQYTTPTATRPDGTFFAKPTTALGWWAVALLVSFVLMSATSAVVTTLWPDGSWRLLIIPFLGIGTVLCGVATGLLALLAVTRRHERSWLVWLPLVVGVNVLFLIVGEFFVSH